MGMMKKPKSFQIQNVASIERRIKLLSVLFEEIEDSDFPLSPSVILSLWNPRISIESDILRNFYEAIAWYVVVLNFNPVWSLYCPMQFHNIITRDHVVGHKPNVILNL